MGSSGHPPLCTPDIFFPTPDLSLSLSLAGPFGRNEEAAVAARGDEVEGGGGGDGRTGGDGLQPGEAVEISSRNTEQGSQYGGPRFGEEACHEDAESNKKRKSLHRHTVEHIRVLEAAFKKSSHPDKTKRQQLSAQLGLSGHQVKFWFQNRRSKIKVIQKRHENSLLKPELEKLQKQNRDMREFIKNSLRSPIVAATNTEEQLLRQKNAKLEAEVERLRRALGNNAAALPTSPSPFSTGGIQIRSRNSLNDYVDVGHDDKTKKFLELAGRALGELTTMCSSGHPLWVHSVETGREVVNYDEYARLFAPNDDSGDRQAVWSAEASRETGDVLSDAAKLVAAFADVNQWKEMFPSMITKAATLEVIHAGKNDHLDGIVLLMSAEVQTLVPLVPTRQLHFLRHCKKLGADKWAIVDVSFSLDNSEPGAQTSSSTLRMCLKRPSGCIVEEQSFGRHCKVTWVEHVKCRKAAVPLMYQAVTESGLAFGARRWVAALQLQCERRVFSVATNTPTWVSYGVDTLFGRQSFLRLAQRMTSSLYRVIAASRDVLAWRKASSHGDIRVMSRWNNTGEHGEPQGLIASAVLSVRLPVNPAALLGLLRDESRRHEWDSMLPGKSVQSYVTVRKGQHISNRVTVYGVRSSEGELNGKWIFQDSSTSPCESTVAYAPVDAGVLGPMIHGRDSSAVAVLPCGIVVMPDGLEDRPESVTSRKGKEVDRTPVDSAGSLVTLVFQVLATSSATDAVKAVTHRACCTSGMIKKALCGDC